MGFRVEGGFPEISLFARCEDADASYRRGYMAGPSSCLCVYLLSKWHTYIYICTHICMCIYIYIHISPYHHVGDVSPMTTAAPRRSQDELMMTGPESDMGEPQQDIKEPGA